MDNPARFGATEADGLGASGGSSAAAAVGPGKLPAAPVRSEWTDCIGCLAQEVPVSVSPTATTREGGDLDGQRSVLIVDHSDDTREVLQTALARRGLRTLAASEAGAGLELARRHRPDLIVLDLELDDTGPDRLAARFARPFGGDSPCPDDGTARGDQTRLVMLGSLRRVPAGLPDGEFVPKPYHYGPLIRRIEMLLGTIPQTRSAEHAACPADGVARSD